MLISSESVPQDKCRCTAYIRLITVNSNKLGFSLTLETLDLYFLASYMPTSWPKSALLRWLAPTKDFELFPPHVKFASKNGTSRNFCDATRYAWRFNLVTPQLQSLHMPSPPPPA